MSRPKARSFYIPPVDDPVEVSAPDALVSPPSRKSFDPIPKETMAFISDWIDRLRKFEAKHGPWLRPLRIGKPGEDFGIQRRLINTRWLRVRWSNPVFEGRFSFRAWVGKLEIVFDPIPRRDWKRDR